MNPTGAAPLVIREVEVLAFQVEHYAWAVLWT